jgi:hypothetical protein
MINHKTLVFLSLILLQSATATAADAALSAAYLAGKWSESGKEGCSAERAGYVTFDNNGTLVAGNGEAISAVGFWELGDDQVTVHLLVSPSAGGGGGHPFYQQRYYYQYMSPHIISVQSDSFEFTHDTGAAAGKAKTLTRCP